MRDTVCPWCGSWLSRSGAEQFVCGSTSIASDGRDWQSTECKLTCAERDVERLEAELAQARKDYRQDGEVLKQALAEIDRLRAEVTRLTALVAGKEDQT